ncbi:MAG: hypothetical protein LPH21_16135 [Shewanella sp.]|nr:hypothetical protein [Shewanella sp.]MCF1459015.1 hypothetical protein [Shewanella sp.]
MKTMSKSLSFSAKLILIATPMLFNQAYASYSGDCGTLHVLVAKSIYEKYQVSPGSPVVNRGADSGCDKKVDATGKCTDFVFNQISVRYGPDVDIEFKEMNGDEIAKIRVQQNYCFFEAGDITVQVKNGIINYKKYPGSYEDDRPGVVAINSIGKPD